MEKESRLEVPLHFTMAMFGGCVGAYAIMGRLQVFGSAQTANMIELICDILGRNFGEVMIRVVALIIYISAIALSAVLAKKGCWNLKYLAIFFDALTVFALGFLPEAINPIEALYPVFFITAFQWCVFKGAKGYVSSTIFSTNNLKQTVLSFTEYFLYRGDDKIRKQKAEKAAFFGGTLMSFHCGVGFEYLMWLMYGLHGIWFASIPLFVGVILLVAQDVKAKEYAQKQDSVSCM